jgi:AcrR family transcriptional regulator
MSTVKITRADGNETRRRLKEVSQRLFALRGIDSVSIKDIVSAAGQRNNASLHYHFGSKEALIGELLIDGAKLIDAARQAMLDEMAANGGPSSVRAVLEALVRPVSELTEHQERGNTYIRFVANLQTNHRAFFRSTLGDRWNAGYRRCLSLLRDLLADVPSPLLEQRISMMGIYANAIFAAKEAALDEAHAPNRFWTPAHTLENIIDTLQAVLECAPSRATLALLKPAAGLRARTRSGGSRAA